MTKELRHTIIWCLMLVIAMCIGAEVFLVWLHQGNDEALLTIASTCAGALAGMAIPRADNGGGDA